MLNLLELTEISHRAKQHYARWRAFDLNTLFSSPMEFWRYKLMIEDTVFTLREVNFPNTLENQRIIESIERCALSLTILHDISAYLTHRYNYEDQKDYEQWFTVRVSEDTLLLILRFPLDGVDDESRFNLRRLTDGTPIADATALHPKHITQLFDHVIDQQLIMLNDDDIPYLDRTELSNDFHTFLNCFSYS